jgi:hypothetical protein
VDLVRISGSALYNSEFAAPRSYTPPASFAIDLTWQLPANGTPAGYNVYRQENGGAFVRLNATLIAARAYHDATPPTGDPCYRVTAVDAWSQEGDPSSTQCVATVTDAPPGEEPAASPGTLAIRAFPNPARAHASLALRLPTATRVQFDVFNLRGERVARVCDTQLSAGIHTLHWDGRTTSGLRAAAGVYWIVVDAGGTRNRTKLVLLR